MLGYYILEQLYEEAEKATRGGENPCQGGDLHKFVDWLVVRAEAEREKALAEK